MPRDREQFHDADEAIERQRRGIMDRTTGIADNLMGVRDRVQNGDLDPAIEDMRWYMHKFVGLYADMVAFAHDHPNPHNGE